MLEAIALAAGYRVGLYTKPHLVRFKERCRIGGRSVDAAALLPHFEAVERGARRRRAHVLRVHARSRSPALFAATPLDLVDPRGRPRRPARRGQRVRRRLLRSSPASTSTTSSTSAPIASRSAARRRASCGRAGRRSSATRCRRAASSTRPRASAPTCGWPAATSATRAIASSGAGGAAATRFSGLGYPALRGANQLLNAVGRAGRVRGAARAAAGERAGDPHRPRDGRAARPLPGRPGRADARARRRAQPARGRRAGAEPRPDGLLPAHPRRVRRDARQGHRRASWRSMAPLVDAWHFTDLPTPRAAERRRSSPSACARVAAPSGARDRATHATPRRRARRGARAARTPLIESSSSAPSTPWAACSRTDCRSEPAATPPERSGPPRTGSPLLSHRRPPGPACSSRSAIPLPTSPGSSPPMPCSRRARAPASA